MPAATPGSWTDATCTATRCDGCPAACSTSSVVRGEATAWCCHSAVWHTICVWSGPVTQLSVLRCVLCTASRPASVLPPSTFRQTVVLLPSPRPTPVVSNTNALHCTSCSSALFSRRVFAVFAVFVSVLVQVRESASATAARFEGTSAPRPAQVVRGDPGAPLAVRAASDVSGSCTQQRRTHDHQPLDQHVNLAEAVGQVISNRGRVL